MTATKDLANLANTLGAVNLVGHNLKVVKKKKKTTKDMVGLGVTNIVGSSLIKSTAQVASTIK